MKKKIEQKKNNLGVASLVLGILSIFFVGPFGVIFGVIGIILAVKQKRRDPNKIATAGFVTSIIGLVLSILITILILTVIGSLIAAVLTMA